MPLVYSIQMIDVMTVYWSLFYPFSDGHRLAIALLYTLILRSSSFMLYALPLYHLRFSIFIASMRPER